MPAPPTSPDSGVTTATAILGAVTGTIGLLLSIWNTYVQTQQEKPYIKVGVNVGFMSIGSLCGATQLYLKAANHGHKPVTLSSWGFKLPDKQELFFTAEEISGMSFPCELAPGKSCSLPRDIVSFAQSLKKRGYGGNIKLVGFFRDQLGHEYQMKKAYRFNVEDWASHKEA
jgi:hypothetical protein